MIIIISLNGDKPEVHEFHVQRSWQRPMEDKVKQIFCSQVEKEPFAGKFGLKLVEIAKGYSRVEITAVRLTFKYSLQHGVFID